MKDLRERARWSRVSVKDEHRQHRAALAEKGLTVLPVGPPGAPRLVSLDVFRGLTMAAMVLVLNPGDDENVYALLRHAEWHGWTPTDLIFPYFLFIVGVSITLSRSSVGGWGRILRRTAVLFGLGLFLNGFPNFDLATWRIPGVLQRIALCYLAAVVVFRWSARTGVPARQGFRLAAVVAVLLVGYWVVMTQIPPPGGHAGDLSPDGNLAAAIDRALLAGHLGDPTSDPEGLLSTIPAVGTTLLGVLAGLWLHQEGRSVRAAAGLAGAGLIGLIGGLLWDRLFPINKYLWTSSYVLLAGGSAALVFALCYWVIDVRGLKTWTKPFVILGVNAITLFVLSSLLSQWSVASLIEVNGQTFAVRTYIFETFYAPLASPKNASLLYAFTHLVLLFGVLAILYRQRIVLKV